MPIVTEGKSVGKRRYMGWLGLPGVVAVVVAAATTFQVDAQEAHALRTPGAIVAVTRGNEPLVLGTAWQKWLLPKFPHVAEIIGGTIWLPQGGNANALVIWTNSTSGQVWGMNHEWALLVTDDQGKTTKLPTDMNSCSWVVQGARNVQGTNQVSAKALVAVTALPRQSTQLRLRFPEQGTAAAQGVEFVTPNPALRP